MGYRIWQGIKRDGAPTKSMFRIQRYVRNSAWETLRGPGGTWLEFTTYRGAEQWLEQQSREQLAKFET